MANYYVNQNFTQGTFCVIFIPPDSELKLDIPQPKVYRSAAASL
jgi:hypothetical protein